MNGLLMTFCCTHRSAPCSAIIREASSCSRWEQTQRPRGRQNGMSLSNLFSQSTESCGRRGRKVVRARGHEGLEQNSVFWTWQGSCTHELTMVVTACIQSVTCESPRQVKSQHGKWRCLAEELLTTDGC